MRSGRSVWFDMITLLLHWSSASFTCKQESLEAKRVSGSAQTWLLVQARRIIACGSTITCSCFAASSGCAGAKSESRNQPNTTPPWYPPHVIRMIWNDTEYVHDKGLRCCCSLVYYGVSLSLESFSVEALAGWLAEMLTSCGSGLPHGHAATFYGSSCIRCTTYTYRKGELG